MGRRRRHCNACSTSCPEKTADLDARSFSPGSAAGECSVSAYAYKGSEARSGKPAVIERAEPVVREGFWVMCLLLALAQAWF